MLYMMEWRVATDTYDKAHSRFLEGAGALPEGATLLGRWHGPGSGHGWLVVETDKPETVYVHAAEWATSLLSTSHPSSQTNKRVHQALRGVVGDRHLFNRRP